jgi:endonuclease YncB( thermonuclease family)
MNKQRQQQAVQPVQISDADRSLISKGLPLWPCGFCARQRFGGCLKGHSPLVPWKRDCGDCRIIPVPVPVGKGAF